MALLKNNNKKVGARPWKLEFRSSKAFVVSVIATAVFTVRLGHLQRNQGLTEFYPTGYRMSLYMGWYVIPVAHAIPDSPHGANIDVSINRSFLSSLLF